MEKACASPVAAGTKEKVKTEIHTRQGKNGLPVYFTTDHADTHHVLDPDTKPAPKAIPPTSTTPTTTAQQARISTAVCFKNNPPATISKAISDELT